MHPGMPTALLSSSSRFPAHSAGKGTLGMKKKDIKKLVHVCLSREQQECLQTKRELACINVPDARCVIVESNFLDNVLWGGGGGRDVEIMDRQSVPFM